MDFSVLYMFAFLQQTVILFCVNFYMRQLDNVVLYNTIWAWVVTERALLAC